MKSLSGALFSFLSLLLLSGCYETHQEIWFEEDFSGRVVMKMEVKGSLALMLISQNGVKNIDTLAHRQRIESQGGVRVISLKTEVFPENAEDFENFDNPAAFLPLETEAAEEPTEAGIEDEDAAAEQAAEALLEQARIRYSFELEFDALEDLQDLQLMPEDEDSQGQFPNPSSAAAVITESAEGILFQSEMTGPELTGNSGLLGDDAFEDASQTVVLHFPTRIIRSNADEVSEDGKTAYFRMENPAEFINDVKAIEVLVEKPGVPLQIPVVPVVSAVGGLLLLVVAFYLGRRSARPR